MTGPRPAGQRPAYRIVRDELNRIDGKPSHQAQYRDWKLEGLWVDLGDAKDTRARAQQSIDEHARRLHDEVIRADERAKIVWWLRRGLEGPAATNMTARERDLFAGLADAIEHHPDRFAEAPGNLPKGTRHT